MLRRANECIRTKDRASSLVFDEFWRSGELALLFGEPGAGKSFLAVQIAQALAAGTGIASFRMASEPGNVLYVDLGMSDEQFATRFLRQAYRGKEQLYEFSMRFYRDRPANEDELVPWLEEQIAAERIRYVIIDDLSAVMRTAGGTRETMAVMRQLRRLRDKFGISILAVMPSEAPGRSGVVSEADLKGQRSLCRIADSVFALGRHTKQREWRYLVQTRCRTAPTVWNEHNAMWGKLGQNRWSPNGLNFEDRTTEEERKLISEVYSMRARGKTFRQIAKEMGISRSRASRLHQRWNTTIAGWGVSAAAAGKTHPAADSKLPLATEPPPSEARLDPIRDVKAEDACGIRSEIDDIIDGMGPQYGYCEPETTGDEPAQDEPGDPVTDRESWPGDEGAYVDPLALMETDISPFKKVRYIECRTEDGRPQLWYQYDSGRLRKYERDSLGVTVSWPDPARFQALNEADP